MLDMDGEKRQRDRGENQHLSTLKYSFIHKYFFYLYILINFTYFIIVLSSYIHSKALSIIVTFIHTAIDEMPLNITHTQKKSTFTSADKS